MEEAEAGVGEEAGSLEDFIKTPLKSKTLLKYASRYLEAFLQLLYIDIFKIFSSSITPTPVVVEEEV